MDRKYICLSKNYYSVNDYSIVPIRDKDKYDILKWRNEQIFHLRQQNLLTKDDQESYFSNTINALFNQIKPSQLLFSYLKGDHCIAYGGLVHINWHDKNAEISFLIDTDKDNVEFELHWTNFLELIEQIAFIELEFKKIFAYAFDLRPKLYPILSKKKYIQEAFLKDHVYKNGKFTNVRIFSKFNEGLL